MEEMEKKEQISMDNAEIIKGLKETVIFLCICCGDIAGEEKINRMGEAINAAIEKIKNL